MKEKILIVDDDKSIALLLYNFLEEEGFCCETAADGLEALDLLKRENGFDLIILDYIMPRMNGLEFLEAVREVAPQIPVMMISGHRTRENTLTALKYGAIGFVKKPFSLVEVLKNIRLVFSAVANKENLGPILSHLQEAYMEFVFETGEIETDKTSLYLATHLGEMGLIQAQRISRIALAFNEVLINAIEHGNLELPVNYFTENVGCEEHNGCLDTKKIRLDDPHFAKRKIIIKYRYHNNETWITIADEGQGFDTNNVARFLEQHEGTQESGCGRGLMLLKYAVDEIKFNEKGNEVTLIIRDTG